ncbi:methyl-accepting chemotaxis protein [Petroclostridium sp. X23]|uniref:methyl-accepting chemotaxis protein n=1 Tax=Petroclostridium sp. X23 TaxID=3045146 RepID=UPI0024AD7D2A|nr:methyl-accepting chemotaxis protein [Petroclostridium sp. X23]WHH61544.1 methyl-accepting chemotaxis protein [Petroclostridium sp. X23]
MKVSLKAKLLLSFFVLIAVPVVILGYLSYCMTSDALQNTIEQELNTTTGQAVEAVNRTVDSVKKYIQIAAKDAELIRSAENEDGRDAVVRFLSSIQQDNAEILEMVILLDKQGRTVLNNEGKQSNVDLRDREYVKKALQGETVISEVVVSNFTKRPVIAIAQPLLEGSRIVGVLVGSVRFEVISEHVGEIKIGESGYGYMIDTNGLVVYHPNADKILVENVADTDNTELKAIVERMKAGETSSGFYTYEGVYKYVSFQPAGNWVVATTANYKDYMASAFDIRNSTIIIALLAIIIAMVIAYIIASGNIIRPVRKLQMLMDRAGEGDLTVKSDIRTKDEIQALGDSFNTMIMNQSKIVRQVREGAVELAASSEEMAASSEQVNAATQQIAASIHEVAKDSSNQNSAIIETSQVLVQLSSLIQLAQNKAVIANEGSNHTMNTALQGRSKVEETVKAMDVISYNTKETVEILQALSSLSEKVSGIVKTINTIAEQTNLLALNAAIEAARAGEHGRGFTVVAEQVRKLSDESNKGAHEIAVLINEMSAQTSKAVVSMDHGKQAVDNGVKVVSETDQAFVEIIEAVNKTVSSIKEMVEITQDEVASSEQVIKLIDNVATITEATGANSEQVAAATQEQAAAVETVAATAEETSSMANTLESLVAKFKIQEDNNGNNS